MKNQGRWATLSNLFRKKTETWVLQEFGEAMEQPFQSVPKKFWLTGSSGGESRTPSTQSSVWEGSW